jgi:hypothetical protein
MIGDAHVLGRGLSAWRHEARAELGLPVDRFIVMTGHQAGIWHAGIAEKFRVGARMAAERNGVLVHVVVDHDLNDASLVPFPALVGGKLARLALERSPRGTAGTPNTLRKPVRTMRPERAHEVPDEIEAPLAAVERAIAAERGRENLAMQMAHAANALLAPTARVDHTLAATALAGTSLARAMRDGFARLHDPYNAAIAGERIAPLAANEAAFWSLDRADGSRRPFFAGETPDIVAPRALTLTAIARLVLCDVFIHGTGGARYDRAMERWIGAAFGEDARAALAPMAVATATRHAPLARFVPEFDAGATPEALRALEQDPFGDAGATKRALLGAIRGTPAAMRAAFVTMRKRIVEARAARAAEIDALRTRIASNAEARRVHALATDRTWPFPLAGRGSAVSP